MLATGADLPRHPANLTVELVPADQMAPNPRNPYNHLTPEERYVRFVQILAETYKEMKSRETTGASPI
jgi:hypothetical protein